MPVTIIPATANTTPDTGGPAPAGHTAEPLVRRAGLAVTAGAAIWAASIFAVGTQPESVVGVTLADLGALPLQVGLFALVAAQLRTGATGVTHTARAMLRVEFVLLALATAWTVLHGSFPALRDDAWLAVLDLFWPLSMLGLFIIGVKIAFAGRWRGVARIWPLVAESWAIVTIPSMGIFGLAVGQVVAGAHLLIGYAVLGLILARRPELTQARTQAHG